METPAHSATEHGLIRIVLTGSESVGKTTLGLELSAHFGVLCVPEFVRQYAQAKGSALGFGDHGPITKGQIALEDEYRQRARSMGHDLLLQDTDVLSTVVYCHHYFGRCPEFIEEAAVARRPSHYLLLDIDVPWVADGMRDRGDRRAEVHALFVDTLARLGGSVTVLRGTWAERFDAAVHAVTNIRAGLALPSSTNRHV